MFFPWKVFWENEKWTFINVQKRLSENSLPENMFSLHNCFLWSGHQKYNFQFVTINFFLFYINNLNLISVDKLWQRMATNLSKK